MEQGSTEWKLMRAGKVTASRVHTIVAKQKNGSYYAERETYAYELAIEQLTGQPTEIPSNQYMQWGTDHEGQAADEYAKHTFSVIGKVGFIPHPTIFNSGASPDRTIDDDGLLEIKCPTTKTHVNTIRTGEVPKTYFSQIQWQLACMPERTYADFASFDPRMPEKGRLFVKRVERDNLYIAQLEEAVRNFLDNEVAKIVKEIEEAMEKL